MKPIRWSAHPLKNLADREIPRTEADVTLDKPELVSPASSSRQFFMRRYFDDRLQRKMLVRALVEESVHERVVITVYITSKIGKYMKEAAP